MPECLNFNFEDTPEGEFIETILAAQGQLERKQNRRQVIQKQRARLERGYWPFFPPPGYRTQRDATHGKLLTPDEPRAGIIREAFEGFACGRFERQADVLDFLQKADFFSARASRVGYIQDVTRLLTRAIYTGDIEYGPWSVSRRIGHHEPLVSHDTFERVQAKIEGRERLLTRRDTTEDFPLRRFVVCACCRRPYTASWTTKRSGYRVAYYRCDTAGCEHQNRSARADALHERFLNMLDTVQPPASTLAAAGEALRFFWNGKTAEARNDHQTLDRELGILREDIERTAERLARTRDVNVAAIYEQQLSGLAQREVALRERASRRTESPDFETALSRVLKYFTDLRDTWLNARPEQREFFMRVVFDGSPAYDRESGFETPVLSLPFRQIRPFAGPWSHGVETVRADLEPIAATIMRLSTLITDSLAAAKPAAGRNASERPVAA